MDTVTVPVVRVSRSLVAQARLNDTWDAHFIVDTGADITVVSHQVVRELVTLDAKQGTLRLGRQT